MQIRSSINGEVLTSENRGQKCSACLWSEWAHGQHRDCPNAAEPNQKFRA